jgi:hypothetical protein
MIKDEKIKIEKKNTTATVKIDFFGSDARKSIQKKIIEIIERKKIVFFLLQEIRKKRERGRER